MNRRKKLDTRTNVFPGLTCVALRNDFASSISHFKLGTRRRNAECTARTDAKKAPEFGHATVGRRGSTEITEKPNVSLGSAFRRCLGPSLMSTTVLLGSRTKTGTSTQNHKQRPRENGPYGHTRRVKGRRRADPHSARTKYRVCCRPERGCRF